MLQSKTKIIVKGITMKLNLTRVILFGCTFISYSNHIVAFPFLAKNKDEIVLTNSFSERNDLLGVSSGNTPSVNGAYIVSQKRDVDLYEAKMLKLDDLILDGNIVYATSILRMSLPSKDRWMEVINRISFNCAANSWAVVSAVIKNSSVEKNVLYSFTFKELNWSADYYENEGEILPLVCSILSNRESAIAKITETHHKNLSTIDIDAIRIVELFDPNYSTQHLTPLGKYLSEHNEKFGYSLIYIGYWEAYEKLRAADKKTLQGMVDFINDVFKDL